jgi:hypothetical protein
VDIASDFDFSGVYSIALFPLMYFTHRVSLTLRGLPSNVRYYNERLILIISFSILYLLLAFVVPMNFVHPIVGVMIVLLFSFGFYVERKDKGHTNRRYLIMSIITLVIALFFFEFDFQRIMCFPEYYIYPHNYWHLFNGISMFYLYLYIRSESYHAQYDKLRIVLHNKAHRFVAEKRQIGIAKKHKSEQ